MVAEFSIRVLETQNQILLDRLDDLETRSRRANLRILNIPEDSKEGNDQVYVRGADAGDGSL